MGRGRRRRNLEQRRRQVAFPTPILLIIVELSEIFVKTTQEIRKKIDNSYSVYQSSS